MRDALDKKIARALGNEPEDPEDSTEENEMNQEKKEQVDARDERLIRAQRTGHYQDSFTGGGVPMCLMNGRMVPMPGYVEAARRRRAIMSGRMEIENGNETVGI